MGALFFAHSLDGRPEEDWQPLDGHLLQVAKTARNFAEPFSSGDWAFLAGLWHDIGKFQPEFQRRIRNEKIAVEHSGVGAALAVEKSSLPRVPMGRILAYLIAGHHAGLADWYTCDDGKAALQARLDLARKDLERIRKDLPTNLTDPNLPSGLPSFIKADNFHLWIRMLFSCLTDADFLDTEKFLDPARHLIRNEMTKTVNLREAELLSTQTSNETEAIGFLKKKFDSFMEQVLSSAPDTPVNAIRAKVLDQCREKAKINSGIFTLTVPTGGGKTLSSMAFALDQATVFNKSRIIYVIPYTSIIEQTANIFKAIFGPENVIEHHCNLALPETQATFGKHHEKESITHIRHKLATENWDAPIIVTTNVQFFESLFASRPGRCRKLHNIVNSVVILDEAQLISPELISPIVSIMNNLAGSFGVTAVFSTATQPAFGGLKNPIEIIEDPEELFRNLERVEYSWLPITKSAAGTADPWSSIVEELEKHKSVLCVVNKRRDCHDIHRKMPDGTYHLSALMCGSHRSKTIEKIRKKLISDKPVKVISTQLIEAGVDIDFPIVFRAMAGLDSIAQAAGRCNREGRLAKKGKVFIFDPTSQPPPGILKKGAQTSKELLAISEFGIHSLGHPETFRKYFELFHSSLNDTGKDILDLLCRDAAEIKIQFRDAARKFKIIDEASQTQVFVKYEMGAELIDKLRFAGPTREILRPLQRYCVGLHPYTVEKMKSDCLIEEVWEGFLAQTDLCKYDEVTGLDIFSESYTPDSLII